MTRIMGVNILPETLGLWAIDTVVGFLAFSALLNGAADFPSSGASAGGLTTATAIDALLLALTVGLVGVAMGLYRIEIYMQLRLLLLKVALSTALSLPVAWLVARAMGVDSGLLAAGWPLYTLLAWSCLLAGTRLIYFAALRMDLFVRRVVVLGAPQAVARIIEVIRAMPPTLYRLEAVRTTPDMTSTGVARLPDGLWGVVVAGQDVAVEVPMGARRFDAQMFWEDQLGRVDVTSAGLCHGDDSTAYLETASLLQAAAAQGFADAVRRLLDIVLASLLLLLTAPLLLVTALLIRIESPGPVIYRQERVGLGGRTFTIWKFRSMRADAERHGPSWAAVRDPRVTTVGRFIRKVRIDELPQLVNILRGEMSMIGPRPERPHFVEQLERVIPGYRHRSLVKPGLTGWAQVCYPYGASVEDARQKLSYDLYYVKHRNLALDLLILLSTVRVILFQEGLAERVVIMHAVPLAVLVPYLACAAAYAALTTLILVQATRSRTGLWLAGAACATGVWAGVAASGAPPEIVAAFDVARLLAWYGFCYHLYRRALGGGDRVFAIIGLAGVACGFAAVSFGQAGLGGVVSLFSPAILLRMALGIGQLLLLENIYRGAAAEQRWQVGLACCTLGLLAAYDVVVCADAVLLHAVSHTLGAGRPMVAVLVTPLLAVAAARNRQWKIDIHVSRTAAFHSATLIVSGIFLMALAVVGEFARHFGPELGVGWGGLAEVYLICAGILTIAVLLTSGSARSAFRRGVVDHFFTHRYDYRQEWQRCITTLSAPGPLPERLIRALADVVDSPAGLLYVREPGQPGMAWFGAWNTSPRGPMEEAGARIVTAAGPVVLAPDQLSLVLTPPAASTDRADGPFVPWLAVPLRTQTANGAQTPDLSTIGCILVARPRAPFRLDDEVFDLLRILAHEVEIHLAQDRAAASLRQTRELRDYSERFAFVAHDVKNVSSQLSLLLANAETHLADPAFQKDMLATVRSSVGRIGSLIRRLDNPGPSAAPDSGLAAPSRIDAAAQVAALLAARPRQGLAVLALDIDPAMPERVELVMEATAFQAAVTHLLDNAVAAAGRSGTVRVGLRATSSQVFIDIIDDGPGMTPEFIRDELFRPFATRTKGGSGLGAFQARSLLRAAGGELAVQSAPGCGTTLRLSLPRAAAKMVQVCDLAPAEV